jgi:hypothetical protein
VGPRGPDQFGGAVADPATDPDGVDVPPSLVDAAPTRRAIARQYDNLEGADRWVGDPLNPLAADGYAREYVCRDPRPLRRVVRHGLLGA